MSSHDDPFSQHSDVDALAKDYEPQTSRLPGPEVLPDGAYTMEIVMAELTKTLKDPESIFRLQLRVLSGPSAGVVIERATFFRQQVSINRLGGDMLLLGLPADQWGKRGKTWSQELIAAAATLSGMKILTVKRTSDPDQFTQKVYHNLDVLGRAATATSSPPPPASRLAARAPATPAQEPDSIPTSKLPF